MRSPTKTLTVIFFLLLPFIAGGTVIALRRDFSVRNREWPTQMQYSPAPQSQSGNAVLPHGMTQQPPVPGTIPRGYQPFHYAVGEDEEARAGRELKNPFSATPENIARGERVYNSYCMVCHGQSGGGDGAIIPKYPNPPSYQSERSKALADGAMFHAITVGRKSMPPHAAQVPAEDRWKAILYIRKLQGKEN